MADEAIDGLTADKALEERISLVATRQRYHGYNVALSYDEPIHMISGQGCSLTDGYGNVWLDCVNNVAHVGHSEPSVRNY